MSNHAYGKACFDEAACHPAPHFAKSYETDVAHQMSFSASQTKIGWFQESRRNYVSHYRSLFYALEFNEVRDFVLSYD